MTRALTLSLFLAVSITSALAQGAEINWLTVDELEAAQAREPRKVMVDVYTKWCGPCKMIAPVLDEVASEYSDKIRVAKLNIDDNPATPPKYGIRGITTFMLFKNGEVEATKVGAVSKAQLTAFLDENI